MKRKRRRFEEIISSLERKMEEPLERFLKREYVERKRSVRDISKQWGEYRDIVEKCLIHFHIEERVRGWTISRIKEAYLTAKARLGRTFTKKEFAELGYENAAAAINRGCCGKNVKTWDDFVASMGDVPPYRPLLWSAALINSRYDVLKKARGRAPTLEEFENEGYHTALKLIKKGCFGEEVKTYVDYVKFRGDKPLYERNKHTKNKIDEAYDNEKKRLGRVPTQGEFVEATGKGAVAAIIKGVCGSSIKNYCDYVFSRGDIPKIIKWNLDRMNRVYDIRKKALGRVPRYNECKELHGAISALYKGGIVISGVSGYRDYLKFRGDTLPDIRILWTQDKFNSSYDELKQKLGRVPRSTDFIDAGYGAALHSLRNGLFGDSIKIYTDYLQMRGEKMNRIGDDVADSEVIAYIKLNHCGETITKLARSADSSWYRAALRRELLDTLVDERVLLRTRTKSYRSRLHKREREQLELLAEGYVGIDNDTETSSHESHGGESSYNPS